MKKVVFALVVLSMGAVMSSADIERVDAPFAVATAPKKPCYGYTIIEFGKGINCNGDTVRLMKVKGGQQLVIDPQRPSAFDPNSLAAE